MTILNFSENYVELTSRCILGMVICCWFDLVERHPLLFNLIVNEHVLGARIHKHDSFQQTAKLKTKQRQS